MLTQPKSETPDAAARRNRVSGDMERIETIIDELVEDARDAHPDTPEAAMVRVSRARLLLAIEGSLRTAARHD